MADRFAWEQKFETGFRLVDEEHRELVRLANKLFQAIDEQHGEQVADGILNSFIDYAGYHFGDEEAVLARTDSPYLREHRLEHEQLTQEIMALKEGALLGTRKTAEAIANWVETRLVPHMMQSDMKAFGKLEV